MLLRKADSLYCKFYTNALQNFSEKLGLSEDYVDFVSKNIDYNLIKSNISKACKLINNYNKFVAQVKELIINVKKDMAENNLSDL